MGELLPRITASRLVRSLPSGGWPWRCFVASELGAPGQTGLPQDCPREALDGNCMRSYSWWSQLTVAVLNSGWTKSNMRSWNV